MKKLRILLPMLSLILLASLPASAKIPMEMKIGAKKLVLNGQGMRKATIFNVKVYTGALYLETKSSNAEEIIASKQLKHISLQFVRDVGSRDIREAWAKGVKKNCGDKCAETEPLAEKLNSYMT